MTDRYEKAGMLSDSQKMPFDYTRCAGTDAPTCQTCERLKQVERDDPTRWYPYMSPAETGGRCVYKIEETK